MDIITVITDVGEVAPKQVSDAIALNDAMTRSNCGNL